MGWTRMTRRAAARSHRRPEMEALELRTLLSVGQVIVAAAQFREESRGAHVRRDHPVRDDARWLAHTVASFRPDGPAMTSKPVVVTKWKPEGRRY